LQWFALLQVFFHFLQIVCWDNAVAESFFSNLKSEQIKKRIYSTRAEAKSEIFDYIEGFYNRVRRHKHLDQLSPYEFEMKRQTAL
jgi:putative transposase